MGRTCLYEERVKPRFSEIKEWLELGATDKEVYTNLRVGKDAWFKYKREHKELKELIDNARKKPVFEIKAALLKRALGFQYDETKVTKKQVVLDDGHETPATLVKTETTTKTVLPDVAACLILLQHWAKNEGWCRDPQALEIKKQELKLKEKKLEMEEW